MTRAEFLIKKVSEAIECLDTGAHEEARLTLLYAIGRIARDNGQTSEDLDGIKKVLFALKKARMGGSY